MVLNPWFKIHIQKLFQKTKNYFLKKKQRHQLHYNEPDVKTGLSSRQSNFCPGLICSSAEFCFQPGPQLNFHQPITAVRAPAQGGVPAPPPAEQVAPLIERPPVPQPVREQPAQNRTGTAGRHGRQASGDALRPGGRGGFGCW